MCLKKPTDVAEQGNIKVVPGPTFKKIEVCMENALNIYSLCGVDISKESTIFC